MPGVEADSPRITSMPVPSGRCRSTSATSGRTAAPRRRASPTLAASATTSSPSAATHTSTTPRRTTSWSSMTITRTSGAAMGPEGSEAGVPRGQVRARRGRGWQVGQRNEDRFVQASRTTAVPQRAQGRPSWP